MPNQDYKAHAQVGHTHTGQAHAGLATPRMIMLKDLVFYKKIVCI